MKKYLEKYVAALAIATAFVGCTQDHIVYNGPSHIMFSDTLYQYAVEQDNKIFSVPVSATETTDYDRTFAVEIDERQSNAVEGLHYRILDNTVTI